MSKTKSKVLIYFAVVWVMFKANMVFRKRADAFMTFYLFECGEAILDIDTPFADFQSTPEAVYGK